MQKKTGLRDRLVSLLELPGDVVLDVTRVTLVGDREMVVENHKGVVEFTPNRVVLMVPEGRLAVEGQDLRIGSISPEQVILAGTIRGMRYTDGGAR